MPDLTEPLWPGIGLCALGAQNRLKQSILLHSPRGGWLFLAISYFQEGKQLTHRCLLRLLELVERFDFCRRQCPVVDADVNSNSARGKH